MIVANVKKCARCDEDHDDIVFEQFKKPFDKEDGDWTHWAMCPVNT